MLDGFFRGQIAFLEAYYGTKINNIHYLLLWEYFKSFKEKHFQKICEKIIETFRPSAQNPFPLVIHFIDAITELEILKIKNCIPEYKLLPEPDDGRMNQEELTAFMGEVMKKISKNMSMPAEIVQ